MIQLNIIIHKIKIVLYVIFIYNNCENLNTENQLIIFKNQLINILLVHINMSRVHSLESNRIDMYILGLSWTQLCQFYSTECNILLLCSQSRTLKTCYVNR